jgi:signal transduction histidine kinase/tetratricopeptide (TPR) repeat protein
MVLLLVLFNPLEAQFTKADSLLERSRNLDGDELGKVYYEISLELKDDDPDSALYYANQAELILTRNDPERLLPYLFKSKGRIYEKKLAFERSLFYYRKAYEEFIKMEDHLEIGSCALHMGNIYYEMADFSEAYYFYLQSLNAYEQSGNRAGIARMENNLGTVAHEMGKLEEAEKHYLNALEIYREHDLVEEESNALNNIGLILYDRQEYDSALHYFQRVTGKIDPDSIGSRQEFYTLSGVYNNMALAYVELREYGMALRYLREGLSLAKATGDQYTIGSVFNNLGSLYREMENQDSALFYLHRSLQIANRHGFRHLKLETYDELAKLHAQAGSYMSAYNWTLRYDTVYKELFNEIQSEQIARLRARYEQELKDREIEQLQSESQVQRMLNKVFISFIVVIVVLIVIIAFNLRDKKLTNQMLAERNLQISDAIQKLSESEEELQKLNQSKDRIFSVVAHDLRNPVAAVTGFSELLYDNFDQFPVETQKEYLLQILQGTQRIQNLLENLLIWARAQMKAVKYEPETIRVKNVVDDCVRELKANLDHKKIECSAKIDRKCVAFADRSMVYTVFRNLIMNAIKFSFPGGKIRISSEVGEETCSVTVTDEGIGIQPEIQKKLFKANEVVSTPGTTGESGSGLGLVICKEFVERNQGSIRVESEPGNGSSFIVTFPLSGKD